jgi:hypothetical protein
MSDRESQRLKDRYGFALRVYFDAVTPMQFIQASDFAEGSGRIRRD